jgi:hypothetical protein
MTSVVDSKVFGKPANFEGSESEWTQWSFIFTAYIYCLDAVMGAEMTKAGTSTTQISMSTTNAESRQRSSVLYNIMVMLWKKKALTFLQLVEVGNGYEAWRGMKARLELSQPGRHLGMLQKLLKFDFGGDLIDKVQLFELELERYESQSVTVLDDAIKLALLLAAVPEELRTQVYMNAASYTTYGALRTAAVTMALGRKQFHGKGQGTVGTGYDADGDVDMNAFSKGKGKGKNKGKDKDKGKYQYKADKGKGDKKGKKDATKTKDDGKFSKNTKTGEPVPTC